MHPDSSGLMARAAEIAGLEDFGPDAFRDGLSQTLAGFDAAPLTAPARSRAVDRTLQQLVNRLRIEDWYFQHPELKTQTVDGPLLVVGLPRSGTTATSAMFALDRSLRFPRRWEMVEPIPPPIRATEHNDPRAIAARAAATGEGLRGIRLTDPDGPDQDHPALIGLNFRGYHGALPMPDEFISWWIEEDFASSYAYHERVLKLLQSSRPPTRWLVNANPHLFKLEAFAAQYPSAVFIMTHRDPLKTIPSVASLYWRLVESSAEPARVDRSWAGERSLWLWTQGMRLGMAARDRIGEHRFIDVHNTDIVQDPVGAFERIYDRLGRQIDLEFAAALRRYRDENPPGKDGGHRYTAEEYGLSPDRIGRAFRTYIDRFGRASW